MNESHFKKNMNKLPTLTSGYILLNTGETFVPTHPTEIFQELDKELNKYLEYHNFLEWHDTESVKEKLNILKKTDNDLFLNITNSMELKKEILKALSDFERIKKDYSLPNSNIDIGEMYYYAGKFEILIKKLLLTTT